MHKNRSVFVSGLLACLIGAGQVLAAPFAWHPDAGVQIAVRVTGPGEGSGVPPEASEEERPEVTNAPSAPDADSESHSEVANEPPPPAAEGDAQPRGGDADLVGFRDRWRAFRPNQRQWH